MKKHPLLSAWWLEILGGFRNREPNGMLLRGATLLVALAISLLLVIAAIARFGPWLLQAASMHLMVVAVLISLATSVWVHRGRQKWTASYSQGWLATIPVTRQTFLGIVAVRSLVLPGLIWFAISIATLATALIASPPISVGSLLGVWSLSIIAGSMLGWWVPYRSATVSRPASQRAALAPRSVRPTLAGLSYWPISQARVWLQPRSIARLLLPAMLVLPQNISGNLAIAILALAILAMYLSVLLRATVHVAREGAVWLRPTPMPLGQFSWAVLYRPTLKQLQWTLLGAILLIAAGINAALVIRLAEAWLAIVSVISSIAATHAYYSRTMQLRIITTVGVLAAVENFRQHLALPCALLFSVWQFRRAGRT